MSKQTKSAAAPAAAAIDTSPCVLCKDLFQAEIQAIILVNHGVLTADNKTILEALPLLNTKGVVSVIFNMMTEKPDASIERHYARACHAMIEAIDEAGDQNADLRRNIALRIWAVLYGTLWSAGV